jgi:hypothetical protein
MAAWVIVLIGVGLRVWRFWRRDGISLDEAMLSLNLINRGWAGLWDHLTYNQAAPVGFLMLEKAAAVWLGAREWSLRLVPLAAGSGAVVMGYFLFRRALSAGAGLWALAVFALAEEALNYAAQVKQYSMDLLVTTLMLWLTVRCLQEKRGLLWLAVAGGIGIWFSHAAVFVTAGIGLVFSWLAIWEAGDKRRGPGKFFPVWGVAAMGLFWVASFMAMYFLTLQGTSESSYLQGYWIWQFPPLPVSKRDVMWYGSTFQRIPFDVLRTAGAGWWWNAAARAAALLCAVMILHGAVVSWSRRRVLAVVILATGVCVFAASAVRQYPLFGRLMLFAIPLWLLLAGASLEALGRQKWMRVVGLAAGVFVAGFMAVGAVTNMVRLPVWPDTRGVASYLAEHVEGGDLIYTLGTAARPLEYYIATEFPELGRKCVLVHGEEGPWLPGRVDEVTDFFRMPRHGRVWLVFNELSPETWSLVQQRDRTVAGFEKVGRRVGGRVGKETEVVLIELP